MARGLVVAPGWCGCVRPVWRCMSADGGHVGLRLYCTLQYATGLGSLQYSCIVYAWEIKCGILLTYGADLGN